VRAGDFNELAFFRAIETSGTRALLLGRRALIVLGLPVLTADYDIWIHIDDIETFNGLAAAFDLAATRTPAEARTKGRYVLENDERVDVLVARAVPTVDGIRVAFDDLWSRRRAVALTPDLTVALPSIADLILTKRFAARPKDAEDIRLLRGLAPEDAS
jgi:hypothetical protein